MSLATPRRPPICFDLDGTLADSAEGIIFSLTHALAACSIEAPRVEWRRFVGPPLQRMITAALPGVRANQITDVVAAFREHYATTGLFRTVAFNGIREMLEACEALDYPLYVITNKPQPQAEAVLDHLGLASCFRRVVGGDPWGRVPKAERAAELAQQDGLVGGTFVGDGIDDLHAAARMGAEFVLAAWGYGVPHVLEVCPEVKRLERPPLLSALVGRDSGDP